MVMRMNILETHIDGLVGPTHHYAGLSYGNIASQQYALSVSHPKQAALQGLQKMKFLHDLGIPQMVMPPHPRPDRVTLRRLGFASPADVPADWLHPLYSASAMWVANAATISPSADTEDGKVHMTPANLVSTFHRSLEPRVTAHYLKQMFPGECFVHHNPLPAHTTFADEGAANHMRLCTSHAQQGLEIFVSGSTTKKYPARQSRHASEAIIRLHRLHPSHTLVLQQNPKAIDAGVFHNDVIAMSNERLLIHHEYAYENILKLPDGFTVIVIDEKELALRDAVETYFFNSQIVTLPDGSVTIIAPKECEEHSRARACFDRLIDQGTVHSVHYLDVRESMKNGGGPACLRLRAALTAEERQAAHSHVWLNEPLYLALCQWIDTHYRDKIASDDLRDPLLARESENALAELLTYLQIQEPPDEIRV